MSRLIGGVVSGWHLLSYDVDIDGALLRSRDGVRSVARLTLTLSLTVSVTIDARAVSVRASPIVTSVARVVHVSVPRVVTSVTRIISTLSILQQVAAQAV